jgi:photosystem I protein
LVFLKKALKLGEKLMTAKSKISAPAKPSYLFRSGWAILLLAINFLVAAYYFHIVQ